MSQTPIARIAIAKTHELQQWRFSTRDWPVPLMPLRSSDLLPILATADSSPSHAISAVVKIGESEVPENCQARAQEWLCVIGALARPKHLSTTSWRRSHTPIPRLSHRFLCTTLPYRSATYSDIFTMFSRLFSVDFSASAGSTTGPITLAMFCTTSGSLNLVFALFLSLDICTRFLFQKSVDLSLSSSSGSRFSSVVRHRVDFNVPDSSRLIDLSASPHRQNTILLFAAFMHFPNISLVLRHHRPCPRLALSARSPQ